MGSITESEDMMAANQHLHSSPHAGLRERLSKVYAQNIAAKVLRTAIDGLKKDVGRALMPPLILV